MPNSSNDMTIKDVRTTVLDIPYVDPPQTGLGIRPMRNFLVAEVETAGGIVGMGYIQPLGGALDAIESCLHEVFKPLLLGRDASEVEGLWQAMWRGTYSQGRMGLSILALSVLDIALWDALGKRANLPLHRLWGSHATELPIYGSGCFRGMGGEGMLDKARSFVEQGFTAIKMQVAHVFTPAEDVVNVRLMRDGLGPDIRVMIDVNQGWSADVAIQTGRKLEACDVYWLEEPVPAHDFEGYRRVAHALDMRIVGGENHFTRFDLRPFFTDPCLPILQPDVMRGGLTELRKIAAVADTWGIRIAPHLFHELMTHVLASIPNGESLEYMGWHDDLWVEPVSPLDGKVVAPERPGHGLAFKPELLKEYARKG